jgi:hypothetical protein
MDSPSRVAVRPTQEWFMSRFRAAFYWVLLGAAVVVVPAVAEDRPKGFEQILPRGRISAIDHPVYVEATDARIPDDARILGFVIEGQAFAYSVNLLGAHEVVNDEVAGHTFAAVW